MKKHDVKYQFVKYRFVKYIIYACFKYAYITVIYYCTDVKFYYQNKVELELAKTSLMCHLSIKLNAVAAQCLPDHDYHQNNTYDMDITRRHRHPHQRKITDILRMTRNEEAKRFALTLHFYSPWVYEYLRTIFVYRTQTFALSIF